MRLKYAALFTLVAVCMLLPTWTAFAQTPAVARLLVTVVDPSGSVIRGATVVTRSLDDAASTQALKSATTSGAGLATFDGLKAGRYGIQASFPGFQMGMLNDVRLRAGDNKHVIVLALQSLQFWLLFLARVFAAGGTTVIVTHQVAHVVDIGYSRIFAASIFGLVGITSTVGRVVFGYIADLFSKQAAYTLNIVTTLIGVGALMAARDPFHTWLLYVYLLFFGVGFGSRAVIFSALAADIFSGKKFGAIFGYSVISVGLGGALGSWLGGVFFDVTGSYLISFALSSVVLVLSDLCIWLASMRRVASYAERLWSKKEF